MTGHTEGGPSSAERDDEPEAEPKGEPERAGATVAADVTQLVEPPARTVETADPAAETVEVERPTAPVAEAGSAEPAESAEDDKTVEAEQPSVPAAKAPESVETVEVEQPPAPESVETVETEPVIDPVVVDSVVVDPAAADDGTVHPAADPWAGEEDPYGPYDAAPGTTVVAYEGEVDGWAKADRRHRRQTLTFAAGLGLVLVVGLLASMTFLGRIAWPFGGKVDVNANLCTRSKPLLPKTVTLRVYNGSGRTGLAMQVTRQLQAFGFVVEDTGNDPLEAKVTTPVEVRHGDTGVLASRTTAAYLVGTVHDVVDDRQSESVDVVLGPTFTRVKTRKEVTAALAALTSTLPETCPVGATPSGAAPTGAAKPTPKPSPKPSASKK